MIDRKATLVELGRAGATDANQPTSVARNHL